MANCIAVLPAAKHQGRMPMPTSELPPRWHELYSRHAATYFWIAMGAGTGACIAVYFSPVRMQPELASMLGGILGAAIGALGAGLIAVWLYRRQRTDELRPMALEFFDRYDMLRLAIGMVTPEAHMEGNIDILEYWLGQTLMHRKQHSAAPLGARINDLNNDLMLLLGAFREQIDGVDFGEPESLPYKGFFEIKHRIESILAELLPELQRICRTD